MAKITRYRVIESQEDIPESLEGFKTWEFTTGIETGEDFEVFARLFREYIRKHVPSGAKLVKFSKNHYEVSGFIERYGNFVYFSIDDVRFFAGEWFRNILIRTAESVEDFTGGPNNYTSLEDFPVNVARLLPGDIQETFLS